jgi:hypothetical protein
MPIELSELLSDERWVEVPIGESVLNVAYRPNATSLLRQAEIQRHIREMQGQSDADEVAQAQEMAKVFCEMVCDWDLTEQGKPLPVTPEIVAGRLPPLIFSAIMTAIGEDGRAQQEEKKVSSVTSDAGSLPKGKRVTARNGIPTSEPRGTWA